MDTDWAGNHPKALPTALALEVKHCQWLWQLRQNTANGRKIILNRGCTSKKGLFTIRGASSQDIPLRGQIGWEEKGVFLCPEKQRFSWSEAGENHD
jgi:hypothetical protein